MIHDDIPGVMIYRNCKQCQSNNQFYLKKKKKLIIQILRFVHQGKIGGILIDDKKM